MHWTAKSPRKSSLQGRTHSCLNRHGFSLYQSPNKGYLASSGSAEVGTGPSRSRHVTPERCSVHHQWSSTSHYCKPGEITESINSSALHTWTHRTQGLGKAELLTPHCLTFKWLKADLLNHRPDSGIVLSYPPTPAIIIICHVKLKSG